jgi:hypothetical protein
MAATVNQDDNMTELEKIGRAILSGDREPSGRSPNVDSVKYRPRQFFGPTGIRKMG